MANALDSVADYVTQARVLLQDTFGAAYRYSDLDFVQALNLGLIRARQLRADLFIRTDGVPPYFDAFNNAPVPFELMYRQGLLMWMCGQIQLRDGEDTTDDRAAAMQNAFITQLVYGVAPPEKTYVQSGELVMDYTTRIITNARIKLTGAIDDAIKLELFNVVDDFLRETDIWQEDIPFVTVENAPDLVYDLVPTMGTILRLIDMRQDNLPSPMRTAGAMRVPGELVLITPYDAGVPLIATVSLAPLDPINSVTEFPDIAPWIWHRYFPAFTDGLIATMAAQADKPYTDINLLKYHGNRFRNAISVARADNIKANVADGQAWRFPDFAAQRNSSTQVR